MMGAFVMAHIDSLLLTGMSWSIGAFMGYKFKGFVVWAKTGKQKK